MPKSPPLISRTWLICLVLWVVTFALYSPVFHHNFVNYDDPEYVGDPHIVRGLTSEGIAWAFGNIAGEHTYWHPITWVSHMIDNQIFGSKAGFHHLVNVFFHATNAVLLFLLLRRLTGAIWCSAFVAMLFAMHPLQVDTVAWVAERKNLLSTLFWLLTLLTYLLYSERRKNGAGGAMRFYLLMLVFYALGLMSKPMLVTLPCVLLLLDFWPLNRFAPGAAFRLVLEKVPLFMMAFASGLITIAAHHKLKMFIPVEHLPLSQRLSNVAVSYYLYFTKTFWPAQLAVYYPIPIKVAAWMVRLSIVLVVGVSLLAVWQFRRRPYLFVGWFWFIGTLVPVIGLWQVGLQLIAERFMYIPIIGLFVAAIWTVAEFAKRPFLRNAFIFCAALILVVASVKTAEQITFWSDTATLFKHDIAVIGESALAANNVGTGLMEQKNWGDAELYFRRSAMLDPNYFLPHFNYGQVLVKLKRYEEAEKEFSTALKLRPDYFQAELAWANLLFHQRKPDEALPHFLAVIKINPNVPESHYQIAVIYSRRDPAKAVVHFHEALRLQPRWLEALNNLSWLLSTCPVDSVRNGPEALSLAQSALKLTNIDAPGAADADTIDTIAAALAETGQFEEAVRQQERAIKLAKNPAAVEGFKTRLRLYQEKQPYRES